MNAEVKKLWIEALRSGEYEQGRGRLKTANNGYCCLGVLCELHREAVEGSWEESDNDNIGSFYEGQRYSLPKLVMKWAGLNECNPRVGYASLETLNDSGVPFPEIANYIEAAL